MGMLPSEDANSKVERSRQREGLDLAHVLEVGDDSNHMIKIEVVGPGGDGTAIGSPDTAAVLTPTRGDINVPSVGDIVVLAWMKGRKTPVVLGTLYSKQNTSVPSYESDERVIGHSATDAEIRISANGSVTIIAESGDKIEVDTNDGSVRINDGSNPVVTDVSGTGVSTVTKSDKLKVP